MVSIEDELGLGRIQVLLLAGVPGQVRNRLQVIHADVVLLISGAELPEFFQLAHRDLLCLVGQVQLLQASLQLVHFAFFLLRARTATLLPSLAFFYFLLESLNLSEMSDFQLNFLRHKI